VAVGRHNATLREVEIYAVQVAAYIVLSRALEGSGKGSSGNVD